jgi:AcrR family transcriptional regulator
MDDVQNTEQKILLTTLGCINEHGIDKVTVRMIAMQAGVNVAAVNYYFRSKERLMEQAIDMAMQNMFEDVDKMLTSATDGKALVNEVLEFLLWGINTYPGITRSFLYGPVVGGKAYERMISAPRDLMIRLRDRLIELCPGRRRDDLEAGIMGVFSTILMGCVAPELFEGFDLAGFHDEAAREGLVESLARTVVGE